MKQLINLSILLILSLGCFSQKTDFINSTSQSSTIKTEMKSSDENLKSGNIILVDSLKSGQKNINTLDENWMTSKKHSKKYH